MIKLTHFPEEVAHLYLLAEADTAAKQIRPFSAAEARYQAGIMSIIRSLYSKRITLQDAITQLRKLVRSGLRIAWNEGAIEAGATTNKQVQANSLQLSQIVQNDLGYTFRLMMDIDESVRKNDAQPELEQIGVAAPAGKSLKSFLARGSIWANRFRMTAIVGFVAIGSWLAKTGAIPKMPNAMWLLGVAEHCDSCVSLAGTVKPLDVWFATGILPRIPGASYLDCGGYKCQCRLRATSISKTNKILRPFSRLKPSFSLVK